MLFHVKQSCLKFGKTLRLFFGSTFQHGAT